MADLDALRPEVQKALNRIGIYVDGKLLGENLDIIKAELLRLAKIEMQQPFGFIGWREQKCMNTEHSCNVFKTPCAELDITTPVYLHTSPPTKPPF